MSPRTFGDAMAVDELMPPKSTRFLPKLVSGLVWHEQVRRPGQERRHHRPL